MPLNSLPPPLRRLIEALALRMGPYAAMWVTLMAGAAVVLTLAAFAGEIYEDVTEADGVSGFDLPILGLMVAGRTPWLAAAGTAFTNLGGPVGSTLLAVVALAVLSLASRSWRPTILLAVAAGGSLLMTVAGKDLIGRLRPDTTMAVPPFETSPSFPSGHTLNTTTIMAVVAYLTCLLVHRTWVRTAVILACGTFAVAMGLSRVFLGHHWFTDVLAAWVLGLAWAGMVILAHRVFHIVGKVRAKARLEAGRGRGPAPH
ncbi:phosphatase PAP2 family protein [Arthrobacter ginkgonis]|uniref:Phosphatase PAP2 family protein n=1 Tax=Arthrobacter ginkgonis TaxID=1630594 RepID=A0ABP7C673_9MICC